jgi:hypothetical protein
VKHNTICSAVVLLVVVALAGCAASSTQGPTAWLDEPLHGAALPLEPTEIMAHASDADGVASLEFYVNGALLVRSPAEGGMLANATVGWNPERAGVYTIAARATDSKGNVGPYAEAEVTVGTVHASPTPSPIGQPTEEIVTPETPTPRSPSSPAPTGTPRPPTPTPPFPTATPRPPTPTPPFPTATPRPPTATPEPPRIASFEVNRSQITAGDCVRFSWRVEGYPTAIYFDGEGVTNPSSADRCPTATRDFQLRAEGPSGVDTRSITVNVIQAPTPTPIEDNTPPSISDITLSATTISTSPNCTSPPSKTTISARVWDESGVWAVIATLQLAGSPAGTVVMTQSAPDVYEVELGPFLDTGNLEIKIMAQDYHANTAEAVRNVTVSTTCVM